MLKRWISRLKHFRLVWCVDSLRRIPPSLPVAGVFCMWGTNLAAKILAKLKTLPLVGGIGAVLRNTNWVYGQNIGIWSFPLKLHMLSKFLLSRLWISIYRGRCTKNYIFSNPNSYLGSVLLSYHYHYQLNYQRHYRLNYYHPVRRIHTIRSRDANSMFICLWARS